MYYFRQMFLISVEYWAVYNYVQIFLFSINVDFLHIFKHLICTLIYMTNNC